MRHVPTPRPRAALLLALVVLLLVPVSVGVGVPGVPGVPRPVPAEALTSVTPMLSSFGGHTCMLLEDSTVRCWGENARGQLGDGTTTFRTMPVTVVLSEAEGGGPLTGVIAISAGSDHTCALIDGGTVRCWGANGEGQLGIGTSGSATDSAHPVPVVLSGGGQLTGVTAIAAGAGHTCALTTAGGGVQCWGANGEGQLGDGSATRRTNPVTVLASGTADSSPVDLTAVTAISAGVWHTCALIDGGTVRCWGNNDSGQLGDDSATRRTNPVAVVGIGGTGSLAALSISAGGQHTCAMVSGAGAANVARCWGANDAGQLGNGTTTGSSANPTPTEVFVSGTSGTELEVTAIATGTGHTCALTASGGAQCWGANGGGGAQFGQLGDGTGVNRSNPVAVRVSGTAETSGPTLTGVTGLAPGNQHSCALVGAGSGTTPDVRCWGHNDRGQLGDTTATNRFNPVAVVWVAPGTEPPPVDPPAPVASGPAVSCAPDVLAVGTEVACTVTGGDPGIDILWRAAVNPVIASDGVTLDADGRGTFGFTVPPSALGGVVTVELVEWTRPVAIGGGAVVGGPVPSTVPAGEGGTGPAGLLALIALLGAVGAVGVSRGGRPGFYPVEKSSQNP